MRDRKEDTKECRREGHVKTEVENVVRYLQSKKCQRLMTVPRHLETLMEASRKSNTLTMHFCPPEL